jgi:hypothetical protein
MSVYRYEAYPFRRSTRSPPALSGERLSSLPSDLQDDMKQVAGLVKTVIVEGGAETIVSLGSRVLVVLGIPVCDWRMEWLASKRVC